MTVMLLEELYSDDRDGDLDVVEVPSGSVRVCSSLSLGQIEAVYARLAAASHTPASLTLADVEKMLRDLSLWPMSLDLVCRLAMLAGRSSTPNDESSRQFFNVSLTDVAAIHDRRPGGCGPNDVLGLAKLARMAAGNDTQVLDVYSSLTIETLAGNMSRSALRTIDTAELRHILESLIEILREREA